MARLQLMQSLHSPHIRFLPGWDVTVGGARNGGQLRMVLWEAFR